MKLATIFLLALTHLGMPFAHADRAASAPGYNDAGAPRPAAPLFEILNDPYAEKPQIWLTYKLDLVMDKSGDLASGHYYGGRENGVFTIDEVKSPHGAVLMKSKEGIEALKLLGPSLSAKDGGRVTFTYLSSPFEEPGQLEMTIARGGAGWTATETATGKSIRQLRLKTRFCGPIGPCGIESVTIIE